MEIKVLLGGVSVSREWGGIKEKLSKRGGCIIQQLSGWPEIHLTYSRHSTYIYIYTWLVLPVTKTATVFNQAFGYLAVGSWKSG